MGWNAVFPPCQLGCGELATTNGMCVACNAESAGEPAPAVGEVTTYGRVCKGQKVMDYAGVFGPDVDVWVMAHPQDLGDGLVRMVVSNTGTPDSVPVVVTYEADATTRVVDESDVIAANTWVTLD